MCPRKSEVAMHEEKAGLDVIEVELEPSEAFELVEKEDPPAGDEKKAEDDAGEGADGDTEKEPEKESGATPVEPEEGEHEERVSRRDKRISQLVRQRKEADEARAAAEAALAIERQKHSKQEDGGDDDPLDAQLAEIDKQIADEADDPAMAAVLKSQRLILAREKARGTKVDEPPPKREKAPDEPHPSAKKWLSDNDWYTGMDDFGRPVNPALKIVAEDEYARTRDEYGGDSDEMFKALDKRLREYPEFERVFKANDKADDKPATAPRRPTRQNTSPSNAHGNGDDKPKMDRDGLPNLDDHDKRKLAAMKLDPNDPDVRRAYMKYNPRKFRQEAR